MDISSPLKPDVFRVVVVILLPGMLTALPWMAWFLWPDLLLVATWKNAGLVVGSVVMAVSLTAGMVLEDIGSQIEVHHVDHYVCRKKAITYADFDRQWMSYLFSSCSERFVAQRYLRAMVTRLKFELSMIPACLSAALATALAWAKGIGFGWQGSLGLVIVAIVIATYLLDQARRGAWQLHEIRLELCKRELAIPSMTSEATTTTA